MRSITKSFIDTKNIKRVSLNSGWIILLRILFSPVLYEDHKDEFLKTHGYMKQELMISIGSYNPLFHAAAV